MAVAAVVGCGAPPANEPDQLAFVSDRDGENLDGFLTTLDTTYVRNLPRHPSLEWGLAWSPDGSKLLVGTDRDGNAEVHVMNAYGNDPRNLTNHPAGDGSASRSPEGREIVCVSDRDGEKRELYLRRTDRPRRGRRVEAEMNGSGVLCASRDD